MAMARPRRNDSRSNRIDPELAETHHREHLDRYRWAQAQTRRRRVLDIGCAFGYGSALLAPEAASVTGIDLFDDALVYAREHYGDRCVFAKMDATALEFSPQSFDAVTCFEVIEHVQEPLLLLGEIRRVIAPGGVVMLSTPIRQEGRQLDPTHLREYSPPEFRSLLQQTGFEDIRLLGQHLAAGVWKVHDLSAKLARGDHLGIRRMVPAAAKRLVLEIAFRLRHGQRLREAATTDIRQDLEGAAVQLALCQV